MSPTILIIDPDQQLIHSLREAFAEVGYQTVFALSGQSGLNAARLPNQPDLILLEVVLPDMNGFEVCQAFQNYPTTKHLPVIFLSSRTTTADKLTGFESGGIDYITKPFVLAELKTRVKTIFYRQSLVQQQINSYKETLSRVMHHEIRTPLAILLNVIELMNTSEVRDSSANFDQVISWAQQGLFRLNQLTEDFLISSQDIAANHTLCQYKLSQEIDEIVALLRRQYEAKSIEISVDMPAELTISLPVRMTRHLIGHLLDNACKFSPPGGQVAVSAEACGELGVNITIQDEGPGIPSHLHEKIFEKFYRVDIPGSPPHDGLGLGLYVVRRIIQAYQGRLTLESESGKGVILHLTIPGPSISPSILEATECLNIS